MIRQRRLRRDSGITLVEMVLASAMLAIVGGSTLLVSNMSTRAFRTETLSSQLQSKARRAMTEITTSLRTADANGINPPGVVSPDSTATIDYLRCVGFTGGVIDWGNPERLVFEYDDGDPNDGVDNDGDGLVDEGKLVHIENPGIAGERRAVLCNWVPESLEGEIAGNLIDDNGNGLVDEGGFCVAFEGESAVVRLSVARVDGYGNRIEHTLEKTIALRNTQDP